MAQKTTAFVGNLPFNLVERDLEEFFNGLPVKAVRLIRDRETDKLRGYGFVEFEDEASAREAVNFDGKELFERALEVQLSQNPPRPAGSGRPPQRNRGPPRGGRWGSRGGRGTPSRNGRGGGGYRDDYRRGGGYHDDYRSGGGFRDDRSYGGSYRDDYRGGGGYRDDYRGSGYNDYGPPRGGGGGGYSDYGPPSRGGGGYSDYGPPSRGGGYSDYGPPPRDSGYQGGYGGRY